MHNIVIEDKAIPQVVPGPTVSIEVTVRGHLVPLELVAGESAVVNEHVSVRLITVTPRARKPTGNGKTLYKVTGERGSTTISYVRSQQRAREIFGESYPDELVSTVDEVQ